MICKFLKLGGDDEIARGVLGLKTGILRWVFGGGEVKGVSVRPRERDIVSMTRVIGVEMLKNFGSFGDFFMVLIGFVRQSMV